MDQNRKKTVFVGLSGGVDSSVCALRLIEAGYNVVGVFIKVWHPDFLECNWEQERLDAMRVAAKLEIPFLTCDAEQAYKDDVAAYFIQEYQEGRTPNPDVMCNKYVKFGAFITFAKERGADFIATGHYAQVRKTKDGYTLLRGTDPNKDQSYFLWTLTQEQLAFTLLPVGDSPKATIRTEATQRKLVTAAKKDSQGICFLGHVDIPEFLSHYINLTSGPVLNEQGTTIGIHCGAFVYTIGQRHGFTITEEIESRKPYYVVAKDIKKNTIIVSQKQPQLTKESTITLRNLNLIAFTPTLGDTVSVQTRYRQKTTFCTIVACTDTSLTLRFNEETDQVSFGQSCVMYKGDVCLGGGIITP